MAIKDHFPSRRSIRLEGYDYRREGWYFVTICVDGRRHLLGRVVGEEVKLNRFGLAVENAFSWLRSHFEGVSLDQWIVMPNHVHLIVIIDDNVEGGSRTAPTGQRHLGRAIAAFKTVSTKRINQIRNAPGAGFWQRNYYEHIIRSEKALDRIREYIESNPINWAMDPENSLASKPVRRAPWER